MLKDKIVALLAEADPEAIRELFHGGITEDIRWDSEEITEFRKLLSDANIKFEFADRYGGEDQGSDYWSIYLFTDGMEAVFVKFYGWYASHCGSEYRGYKFVAPKEKTITVYE